MSVGCAMRTMNQQLATSFRCARRTLVGEAAEIEDHTTRGRNMDTRTAASKCRAIKLIGSMRRMIEADQNGTYLKQITSRLRLLVIPAQAGIQGTKPPTVQLDPGLRRDDRGFGLSKCHSGQTRVFVIRFKTHSRVSRSYRLLSCCFEPLYLTVTLYDIR